MGIFRTRIDYFENLCYLNKQVKHNRQDVDTDNNIITRRSFISIDDPDQLDSAVSNLMSLPAVVQLSFSGKLVDKNGSVRRVLSHSLYFLCKVQNADVSISPDERANAYDTAESIMNDFIARMYSDYEENGMCGPFMNIDFDAFNFSLAGPVADNFFGWKLSFIEEASGRDLLTSDPTKWEVE